MRPRYCNRPNKARTLQTFVKGNCNYTPKTRRIAVPPVDLRFISRHASAHGIPQNDRAEESQTVNQISQCWLLIEVL